MKIDYKFIVQIKSKPDWYCMICDCNLSSELAIDEHMQGRQHVSALMQYGSDITKIEGNHRYFCKLCQCLILGYQNIYPHVIGKRHTINFNKFPESVKGGKNLDYSFVMKKSKDNYYCALCDCDLTDPVAAKEHQAGSRHADSLKMYGQDIILVKNNYHYACKICNRFFYGYVNIYVHVTGRRHCNFMVLKLNNEKDKKNFKKNVVHHTK